MRGKMKRALVFLMVAGLLGGLGMAGYGQYRAYRAEQSYRTARELAAPLQSAEPSENAQEAAESEMTALQEETFRESGGPVSAGSEGSGETEPPLRQKMPADDPHMDALRQVELTALREVNPNVVGWMVIPGTPVEYPLMQGEDNDYYLHHTWEKKPGSAGAVFLDKNCGSDLGDFHTLVYGHRMRNDSMFGSLKYYREQEYWAEHSCVYIVDDAGVHRYEIFSAYEAPVRSCTYQIGFADDAARENFLAWCVERSVIDTGVIPAVRDRILTLSTCTGTGYETRWVVQARLATE